MHEYFIVANSNAAPFVSDTTTHFILAEDPAKAIGGLIAEYTHPMGLYAANVYQDANDYHKNKEPLLQYLSDRAKAIVAEVKEKGVMVKHF